MKTYKLSESNKLPVSFDGRAICKDDNIEIVHITLKPGEDIEKHVNALKVFFYVLEGSGFIISDEQQILIKKDSSIEIEAGVERYVKNLTDSNLRILVIKILP